MALRRVRRNGRAYRVIGLVRDDRRAREAVRRGAADAAYSDPKTALHDADVVVFCVPVQSIIPVARRVLPFLKRGTILTDVGSVKGSIQDGMRKLLRRRKDLMFVGAHPMAGSERTGVESAKADLFRGATCAIALPAPKKELGVIRRLWNDAGAACVELDAHRHDDLIALISHLPHLLAFSLFSQVSSVARRDPRVRSLVAGSFRDMTRVAASSPDVWSGIFDLNGRALQRALRGFVSVASRLRSRGARGLKQELARIAREKKAWSA